MAAAKPQLNKGAYGSALALLAVATLAACGGAGKPAEPRQPAPDRRAALPAQDARYVHRTFHRLRRFCAPGRLERRRVAATTTRFLEFYRRYPADRYRMKIDDEWGNMLSAILVLRDELSRCSPRAAARIDPVLPEKVRRALRPLPAPSH